MRGLHPSLARNRAAAQPDVKQMFNKGAYP